MTTKITATFTDGDESTVRTLTLPYDVSDRVAELIGFGLIAEVNSPHVLDEPDMVDIEVHRDDVTASAWTPGMQVTHNEPIACRSGTIERVIMVAHPDPASAPIEYLLVNIDGGGQWFWPASRFRPVDAWSPLDDTQSRVDRGSPTPSRYSVGDTIEVTSRPAGSDGPALGHRAAVIETSDFAVCIPWEVEGHSGFWLRFDQVCKVAPSVEHESGYQIGDAVEVSPSNAWSTGGRGTIVELDDDEDNFTPVCIECEGRRWWVSASYVKRVESETDSRTALARYLGCVRDLDCVSVDLTDRMDELRALMSKSDRGLAEWVEEMLDKAVAEREGRGTSELRVSPSIWSPPTIAPDGTKTFTAPGVTCVEHPPTTEDGFPTWTLTADTPSEPIVSDEIKVGDTVEVVKERGGGYRSPPIGARALVLTIGSKPDTYGQTIRILWEGEGGWWVRADEVKRVDSLTAEHEPSDTPAPEVANADTYKAARVWPSERERRRELQTALDEHVRFIERLEDTLTQLGFNPPQTPEDNSFARVQAQVELLVASSVSVGHDDIELDDPL